MLVAAIGVAWSGATLRDLVSGGFGLGDPEYLRPLVVGGASLGAMVLLAASLVVWLRRVRAA